MADKTINLTVRVGAAGLAGGFLAWLFSIWLAHEPHVNPWVDPFLSVALGAGAALIFVFLVSNTDRSDMPRLLALGLLAGFFFEPVWVASRLLIDHEQEKKTTRAAVKSLTEATTLAEQALSAAEQGDEEAMRSAFQELSAKVVSANVLAGKADSLSSFASIRSQAARLEATLSKFPASSGVVTTGNLGTLASAGGFTSDPWGGFFVEGPAEEPDQGEAAAGEVEIESSSVEAGDAG